MGNSQALVHGGNDVRGGQRVQAGVRTNPIAGPIDQTFLESTAKQHQRIAEIPMIPARIGVDLGGS
ncbi:MAG: hypothetical protein RL595_1329, partial [Planctomycetota bacterium]